MTTANARFDILKLVVSIPGIQASETIEIAQRAFDFVFGSASVVDGGVAEADAPLLPADPPKRGRKPKSETNAVGVSEEVVQDNKPEPPTPAAAPAAPKVEYAAVQAAVVSLLEAKGPEAVVAILKKYDVATAKVSKPEQWPGMVKDLQAALYA